MQSIKCQRIACYFFLAWLQQTRHDFIDLVKSHNLKKNYFVFKSNDSSNYFFVMHSEQLLGRSIDFPGMKKPVSPACTRKRKLQYSYQRDFLTDVRHFRNQQGNKILDHSNIFTPLNVFPTFIQIYKYLGFSHHVPKLNLS